jgi:regulator of CtrA degradation
MAMTRNENPGEIVFAEPGTGLAATMQRELFERTYEEGMQLVEQTSAYLDGDGRDAARYLNRHASLAYATESMRLTTRLMQVAAWLLIRKAVVSAEVSPEEAEDERYRLSTKELANTASMKDTPGLPGDFLELVERSERLYDRVQRLDDQLRRGVDTRAQAVNPVAEQIRRAEDFFQENVLRFPVPE